MDAITNDQGTVAQEMSFDAFGLRRDPSNWDYDLTSTQIASLKDDTDRGYTDQEQLDNVGLIHMNGRVYDPEIARFISADLTMQNSLYSQSFNRYSYTYNNPMKSTDPSGFLNVYLLMHTANITPTQALELAGGVLLVGGAIAAAPEELTALTFARFMTMSGAAFNGGLQIGAFLSGTDPLSADLTDYILQTVGVDPNSALGIEITLDVKELATDEAEDNYTKELADAKKLLDLIKKKLQTPTNHKSPSTPAAKGPKGPRNHGGLGGGGDGGGPNRNPQFINLEPAVCTYTWYDYYSNGQYIGSGPVSTTCT